MPINNICDILDGNFRDFDPKTWNCFVLKLNTVKLNIKSNDLRVNLD